MIQLTEEQKKLITITRQAAENAKKFAHKASSEGLFVLNSYWLEVETLLRVGADHQERAFRDDALLQPQPTNANPLADALVKKFGTKK